MPIKGHNASHYFYIHPANKECWSKNIHNKDSEFLLGFDPFKGKNNNQGDQPNINGRTYIQHFNLPFAKNHFRLTTTYPGLLIGAGYSHYAIKGEGEDSDYQLGFFFDHTCGVPIIPGSTIKGVLKNVFPKPGADRGKKLDYVFSLLGENSITKEYLDKHWEEIFFKNGNVFFHAFPISINQNNVDNEKKIIADDAITPHHPGDPNAIFKEPTPLKFIKVPAGVTFKFQFSINIYKKNGIEVLPKTVQYVFKQILLHFGICAKRNVGYGQFTDS